MNYQNAAESLDDSFLFPSESEIPPAPSAYQARPKVVPIRLAFERESLRISIDTIEVSAHVRDDEEGDAVDVVVFRMPEGELVWDPVVVDGKLKMVFGFVPDTAFRAVASLFRYNDTLAVS